MVERLVAKDPWTGIGPGAYVFHNVFDILDNEYLSIVITMGLLGLFGFVLLLGAPLFSMIQVAITTDSECLRSLAGAVSAALLVALIASGIFDSLSFPVFTLTLATTIGLAASTWQIARDGSIPFDLSRADLARKG